MMSLKDACLIVIRDRIVKKGHPIQFDLLSPDLRQSILDTVSSSWFNRLINTKKCRDVLCVPEFFDGMTSLNLQTEHLHDDRYLTQAAQTLEISSGADATIGDQITELSLNLCIWVSECMDTGISNLKEAFCLIKACRNLQILSLRFIQDHRKRRNVWSKERENEFRGILRSIDFMQPYMSALENLSELSISRHQFCWFTEDLLCMTHPIIKFKNLSVLKLTDIRIVSSGDSWHKLLENVRDTLIRLEIKNIYLCDRDNEEINTFYQSLFPISMPNLKTLLIIQKRMHCSHTFVENLFQSPKLQEVFLYLCAHDKGHECWPALNNINTNLEIKLFVGENDKFKEVKPIVDESSRFKAVLIFGSKITHVEARMEIWNPRFRTAFEHLFRICENLVDLKFGICPRYRCSNACPRLEVARGLQLILVPLLSDINRASKLRRLKLLGSFDIDFLKPMINNCLNLETLEMCSCLRKLNK